MNPTSEALLIDALPATAVPRIVCRSLGRAQLAAAAAERFPNSEVMCHFLDSFAASESQHVFGRRLSNLAICCQPDLPDIEADLVLLPFSRGGEAELCRDFLQAGHQRLRLGGRMLAAVDNPHDQWLHGEMRKLFDKVTQSRAGEGAVYSAVKRAALKKVKDFGCEFAFRDQGRLLRVYSRPGVFSHRRLDLGARALIEAVTITAGQRVLEIGCGAGAVTVAAASRAAGVTVHALDSNPRAVECTRRSAALNGLENITVEMNHHVECQAESFDVVLMNPPYYSHNRLGEIFVSGARRAMRPQGQVHVVTKSSDWYESYMTELFLRVRVQPVRSYFVVTGEGRRD